jgi:hypothetical protein
MKISMYVSVLGLWVHCAGAFLISALFWLLSRGDAPAFQRADEAIYGAKGRVARTG